MKHALALTVAAAVVLACGCIRPRYTCSTDDDCNVGTGGRCEPNHECTVFDATCPLERRYAEYAGSDSNVCFDDAVVPLDACAGGQPPAPADTTDPCTHTVCSYLPACCTSAWSDACVQEAQVRCGLKCDFDVALVAQSGPNAFNAGQMFELWDLRFAGSSATQRLRLDDATDASQRVGFLAWLAPAPGQPAPRLAGLDGSGNLLVGEGSAVLSIHLAGMQTYGGIASVDFDRDGRDTAVLSAVGSAAGDNVSVLKLDDGTQRALASTPPMPLQSWGDLDGDAFPDAVGANDNGESYRFMANIDDGSGARGIDDTTIVGVAAGDPPYLTSFDWADFNGDTRPDFVAFGTQIQLHFGMEPARPSNTPSLLLDCNPPSKMTTCTDNTTIGFAGAVELQAAESRLIASVIDTTPGSGSGTEPNRADTLYRVSLPGGALGAVTPLTLTGGTCATPCSIGAVVTRDFDGDGILDILAFDSSLNVWMGLSGASHAPPTTLAWQFQLPPMPGPAPPIPILRTSVTGTVAP